MKDLFTRCLNASYIKTPKNGDYAIEVEGDTIYLLFQWSSGIWDWIHNFLFPAKPYKRMDSVWFCHRGFLKVWKAMRDEIEAKVKKILLENQTYDAIPITNIVCVGYSHGGAMSLFATEDMSFLYGDTLNVTGYGFGCPRVIWGIVPKPIKNRLQCFSAVRNIPDLVTHVPPVLFGFRHINKPIEVGERGKYSPIKAHYASAYKNELTTQYGGESNC